LTSSLLTSPVSYLTKHLWNSAIAFVHLAISSSVFKQNPITLLAEISEAGISAPPAYYPSYPWASLATWWSSKQWRLSSFHNFGTTAGANSWISTVFKRASTFSFSKIAIVLELRTAKTDLALIVTCSLPSAPFCYLIADFVIMAIYPYLILHGSSYSIS